LQYFIGNYNIDNIKNCTVEQCLKDLQTSPEIQVDTETSGLDCHKAKIISLQLGTPFNQYFIDCRDIDILQFQNLLETKLCILQNSKFDYKMFKSAGIVLENIYDTMLAECVLYCGYDKWGYGLKTLVKRYCNVDLNKEEQTSFINQGTKPFTERQIIYGLLDVTYLQTIKQEQFKLIEKYNLNYCIDLENKVVKALGDIEYNGMILNQESWLNLYSSYENKQKELIQELDNIVKTDIKLKKKYQLKYLQADLFGYEIRNVAINYSSPLQIKEVCKTLGYPIDSTNDRELTKLVSKHKFFEVLQNLREVNKIISTYGKSFLNYINPATGKIHTSFWQVLNTGRVSSGSKDDNAPNLQNLPANNKFRNCFQARPGFKWVSIDYSGQELRLMADASGEKGFIDVLNSGEDLHCYAGSMMFKKPITKADKDLRNKAKTINFGKPYGMGPPKLADTLGISIEEAENLFEEYAKAFPVLNQWLENQGKFALKNKYSLTFAPCLRRRWYPNMDKAIELRTLAKNVQKGSEKSKILWKEIFQIEGQTQRNGGNSPIQGSGADICKEALVEVRELIKKYNRIYEQEVAFLICTVHDAIDVEVIDSLAVQFSEQMVQIMINCGNKYVKQVQMEVDVTITDVWMK